MTEPRGVSISEIGTFLACRRQWWLKYVRCLQPAAREMTGTAQLGTRVHAGLQAHYTGLDPVASLEALRDQEFALVEAGETFTSAKEIADEHEQAVTMVTGYVEWLEETGADADYEVRAVESRVAHPGPLPERYWIQGKCDLLIASRTTGHTGVRDFKTVQSVTSGLEVLNINAQARMYAMIEWLNRPQEAPRFVEWALIQRSKRTTRAKGPFFAHHGIHLNDDELRRFWVRVWGILRDMAACEDALADGGDHVATCYPSPGNDCSWRCREFLPVCALLDDPRSDAEHAIGSNFVVGDPYERYGDVAQLAPRALVESSTQQRGERDA